MEIKVVRQILEWNEDCHQEVRNTLSEKGVYLVNIMGSPGTGKTTFILNLINELRRRDIRAGVIEGDIEGTIAEDAEILVEKIPVYIRCKECDYHGILPKQIYNCPKCNGNKYEITKGREFYLDTMEVE